jgi:probable HAF family extracellular repeat protein
MKATNEAGLRKCRNLTFGLTALVLLCVGTAAGQPRYKVTDLGTLGGNNSIPFRINNRGQVVGLAETSQADPNSPGSLIFHAFFWDEGVMHDLATLTVNSALWNSVANDVNNHGQVVGWSNTGAFDPITASPEIRAFAWQDGAMTDLGTLGGNNSIAGGINDKHQVVGVTEIPTVDPTFPPFLEAHAFLWEKSVMSDLGTLGVGSNSFANDINERGEAVGGSQVNTIINPLLGFPPYIGFLWTSGVMINLNTPDIGSNAFTINNQAQVVGRIAADEHGIPISHAFLWERGVTRDLGTILGLQDSEALSINDKGQIVGDSGVGPIESFSSLAAWLLDNGVMTDLNTLIPADSGFQLIVAFDINADGQIVACGIETSTGNVHAVLLNPTNGNAGPPTQASDGRRQNGMLSESARKLLARGKSGLGRSKAGMSTPR